MHSIRRVSKPWVGSAGKAAPAVRPARRRAEHGDTRSALLDGAETLLLEEGYAAVTSRRVAERAGANSALIRYYFGSMDGLFVELFRRGAEQGLERQAAALQSPQPLWALWDMLHDHINNGRTLEFFALANHRPVIRAEVVDYSARYRRLQLDVLSEVLAGYGLDPDTWPPAAIILLMGSVSLLLIIENGLGFDMGHAEMIAVVEREIRALEGDRWTAHPALASRRSS